MEEVTHLRTELTETRMEFTTENMKLRTEVTELRMENTELGVKVNKLQTDIKVRTDWHPPGVTLRQKPRINISFKSPQPQKKACIALPGKFVQQLAKIAKLFYVSVR